MVLFLSSVMWSTSGISTCFIYPVVSEKLYSKLALPETNQWYNRELIAFSWGVMYTFSPQQLYRTLVLTMVTVSPSPVVPLLPPSQMATPPVT